MSDKIGRNEPCPCGSGKKSKQCHGREAATTALSHNDADHAVPRVLSWIDQHRRKAFKAGLDALMQEMVVESIRTHRREVGQSVLRQCEINLVEWLLVDGTIVVKGEARRTIDDVLGPDGTASLSPAQRRRIEELRARPLRLYRVTDARPGEGLTVCDVLDDEADPIQVDEHTASRTMKPGLLIGARLLRLGEGGRAELSGSLCGFSMLHEPLVIDAVRAAEAAAGAGDDVGTAAGATEQRRVRVGRTILEHWARQFTAPTPTPTIVDTHGEPLLLITDHYRVLDAKALADALEACDDVSGSAQDGWSRDFDSPDGLTRSSVSVNPGREPETVEVFYRTRRNADAGRPWFESVTGAAVEHIKRDTVDPRSLPEDDDEPHDQRRAGTGREPGARRRGHTGR